MGNQFFKAVAETLRSFFKTSVRGDKPGFMLFLHTWDQRLNLHFHIHALIAGGVLSKSGVWRGRSGSKSKYLFPVKALSAVFRGKFIELFGEACEAGQINWAETCLSRADFLRLIPKQWNVYSKSTDGSTQKVIQYLGRYTHRTGLAKSKLEYDEKNVSILYKNRSDGKKLVEVLTPKVFLHRFAQHFFKEGIQRVRYYGFLANAAKSKALKVIRNQIGHRPADLKYVDPICGKCGSTRFKLLGIQWLPAPIIKKKRRPRGPPGCSAKSALERPTDMDLARIFFKTVQSVHLPWRVNTKSA